MEESNQIESEETTGSYASINESDVLHDPACSSWLKQQLTLERDPIDLLNDIEILTILIKKRIL